MAEADLIWEKLQKQERMLMEFEEETFRNKRQFERVQDDLYERLAELQHLVNMETEMMYLALDRFESSYDAAQEFFHQGEELLAEANVAFRQRQEQLMLEEEEFEQEARHKRDRLEEEVYQLRREYANADE